MAHCGAAAGAGMAGMAFAVGLAVVAIGGRVVMERMDFYDDRGQASSSTNSNTDSGAATASKSGHGSSKGGTRSGQAASASSGSQPPQRPRDGSRGHESQEPNWPEAKSLREANEMVMKELIKYVEDSIHKKHQIPNNAKKWILEILRDRNGPINQFHLTNASDNVVQIDYTFSGRHRDGDKWLLEISINADYPNAKHSHPHHYGGDIELEGMDGKEHRRKVHVRIPADKFKAGRAKDVNDPPLKEFDSGEKHKDSLENGGKAKWKWTSKKRRGH